VLTASIPIVHRHASHAHIHPRTVLTAFAVTLLAAGAELAGSWSGRSLFLVADAVHLIAHLGIFGVLLIPTVRWHERGEDMATIVVLTVVFMIAIGIMSAFALRDPERNRAIVDGIGILQILRAVQRVIFASQIQEIFGMPSGRLMLQSAFFFVLGLLLLLLRPHAARVEARV